jgi:hypothetical protein
MTWLLEWVLTVNIEKVSTVLSDENDYNIIFLLVENSHEQILVGRTNFVVVTGLPTTNLTKIALLHNNAPNSSTSTLTTYLLKSPTYK